MCTSRRKGKENVRTDAVEYHSAMKKDEILTFAANWMKLEIIALHKISPTQKDK